MLEAQLGKSGEVEKPPQKIVKPPAQPAAKKPQATETQTAEKKPSTGVATTNAAPAADTRKGPSKTPATTNHEVAATNGGGKAEIGVESTSKKEGVCCQLI